MDLTFNNKRYILLMCALLAMILVFIAKKSFSWDFQQNVKLEGTTKKEENNAVLLKEKHSVLPKERDGVLPKETDAVLLEKKDTDLPEISSYLAYIEVIRKDCGQLCDLTRNGLTAGKYFNYIKTDVNCEALFKNPFMDSPGKFKKPPSKIPKELLEFYNMNGQVNITSSYHDDMHSTIKNKQWTINGVNNMLKQAKAGNLGGSYGTFETNALRNALKHTAGIIDGRVLVIGSISPWVEACVLEAGAREIVTLEYGSVTSLHPTLKTMMPKEFTQRYLNKTLGLFDAVVTYSSIEHSGLGRYSDALNPWGDIITVARAWCITKEKGGLLIGVPYDKTSDQLVYNAHRIYGPIRYPFLTTNWKQIYTTPGRHNTPFTFEK